MNEQITFKTTNTNHMTQSSWWSHEHLDWYSTQFIRKTEWMFSPVLKKFPKGARREYHFNKNRQMIGGQMCSANQRVEPPDSGDQQ